MSSNLGSEQKGSGRAAAIWIASAAAVLAIVLIVWNMARQGKPGSLKLLAQGGASDSGTTLWQILESGGIMMAVLGVVSILTITVIIYSWMRFRPSKLVPEDFCHELVRNVAERKYAKARQMCLESESLMAVITLAGLDRLERGPRVARDSIELAARKQVLGLWQTVNYLSDITTIAPMLGLAGTVMGMIEAFNTFALKSVMVSPLVVAGGVSKALICTAAGLIIAITAMAFYTVFRTRVQLITQALEAFTTETISALPREEETEKSFR
ncbi:MAG: MotA/TolQ/ExbB proton channel family protein [Candidatus Omnitrophica bacterium]|jgi:biopolymer transport protein ExbB|nr:MotA/TolQ/ExbB proton channel family protein [Candidatus Omnitrophota bacterium]